MNEEQFTIHDEKELFEELSKDKCKRSDILINLNVALQKYQNIVANIKDIREIQEYKIAVVTIENELQKVQEKNQQLIDYLKEGICFLEEKIFEKSSTENSFTLALFRNKLSTYKEILSKIEKR